MIWLKSLDQSHYTCLKAFTFAYFWWHTINFAQLSDIKTDWIAFSVGSPENVKYIWLMSVRHNMEWVEMLNFPLNLGQNVHDEHKTQSKLKSFIVWVFARL